jgi:hypothetical protein
VKDLFIVARPDEELYAYLTGYFAGRGDVQVIPDRRRGERRRRSEPIPAERRTSARRKRSVSEDLASLGFAIVTIAGCCR